ncbi:ribonuclease H-like domain-containing protein, partial [Mycena sp. CBHHK59/15]
STSVKSTLHLTLPALETLHAHWTKCAADPLYSDFAATLQQALEKVDEYYQKTSNSNTYMFAMVLDPAKKLSYFQAHWPTELQESAVENMEETCYLKLHSTLSAAPVPVKKVPATKLRCSVVREDDETTNSTETHINALKPWLNEYQQYLMAREVVPEGMDTIQWQGVNNAARYPVWPSLARDYLAVMSSSVSSERSFSSTGITISKRHNWIKADIVEALQVLKCMIHHDLLFRKSALVDNTGCNDEEDADDGEKEGDDKEKGWDDLLEEDPNNYDPDYDMDI